MSDFNKAFNITIGHEVGYANHSADAGGETYNGIARRYHPNWSGWKLIDIHKEQSGLDLGTPFGIDEICKEIDTSDMRSRVQSFYHREFWRKVHGDDIQNQDLANLLFDVAVNSGVRRSVRYLQRALNLLNREEADYFDLSVDGRMGKKTLNAIRMYNQKRGYYELLLMFGAQMITHWMNRAEKQPNQELFLNGIASRWIGNIKQIADGYYLA